MTIKCQVPPTFKPHLLTTDAAITIVKVCLVKRLFIVYAVISFLKWGQQGFEQLKQADGKTKSLPNDLSVRNKSSRRHKLISSLGIHNKEIIFKVLNSVTKTRWMVVLWRRNLHLCFSCPTNTLHLSHSQILPSLQLKHREIIENASESSYTEFGNASTRLRMNPNPHKWTGNGKSSTWTSSSLSIQKPYFVALEAPQAATTEVALPLMRRWAKKKIKDLNFF